MSRIGKKTIAIPSGVEVKTSVSTVQVKGPKGELTLALPPHTKVEMAENSLNVSVDKPELDTNAALWGLTRALISNMVKGVTEGFTKKLEINGVGYRAEVRGKSVVLSVGYSHPVELLIPNGIVVAVEKNVIIITGVDKQAVGQFAAVIRAQKPPEPYKGKGIKYEDEIVRRKAGKAAKAIGAG